MDAGDEGSDTDDEDDDTDYDTDDDTDDDDTDAPATYLEKSQDTRKEFLREFSDDEVAEMWQIHNFMMFASCYACNSARSPAVPDRGSI